MLLPPASDFSATASAAGIGLQNQQQEFVPCKLFIGGLSYDTTDQSLARYFQNYGDVSSAIVLRDPVTSHSRGFGFVTFRDEVAAKRVLAQSRNHVIDGRKVEAKIAVPKNQTGQRRMMNPQLQSGMPNLPGMGAMGSYGDYGMGMNPMGGMGLGIGDPYMQMGGMRPVGNMNGMGYDMPMYNNQMNMNRDVYPQMQPQNYSTGMDQFDGRFRTELESDFNVYNDATLNGTTAAPPTSSRFDERLNSVRSAHSNATSTSILDEPEILPAVGGGLNPNVRRPTYPNFSKGVNSPTKLRKFSMPPSKLEALGNDELESVTQKLGSFELNPEDEFSPKKIFVTGLAPETTIEKLKETFSNFGNVDDCTTHLDRQGGNAAYASVVFADPASVESVKRYEEVHGKIIIDGAEVSIRRFGETSSIHDNEFLGRILARSNTLPLESREELLGLDPSDTIPEVQAKFPMIRANSVSQTMFDHGIEDEFKMRMPGMNIARDDKMRSLSVIAAGSRSSPFNRVQSETGRRSSTIAALQNRDSPLASPTSSGLRTLSPQDNLTNLGRQ